MAATPKRVLLAEDDKFLRRACERSLGRQGFSVVTAADGEEALRAIRAEPPDLVLLDLLMPKLSGVEVLRALRSDVRTRGIRIVVLTNSSEETEVVREIVNLGVTDYLVKANLSLEELGHRVKQLLEG